jgi:hypothetical protein
MKLTDEQRDAKKIFRLSVLKYFWGHDGKHTLGNVIYDVSDVLFISPPEAVIFLSKIPSIGPLFWHTGCSTWLAKHYPVVSKAMFDKKPIDEVMRIWSTQRYQNANNKTNKRGSSGDAERSELYRGRKKIREIAKLRKDMPDRFAKSSWNLVK